MHRTPNYRTSVTSPAITVTTAPSSFFTCNNPSTVNPVVVPMYASRPVSTRHALSLRKIRQAQKPLGHKSRPFPQKPIVVALEFPQQPHQQFQPRMYLAAFHPQRRRNRRQLRGKFLLIHIDPHPHDHKSAPSLLPRASPSEFPQPSSRPAANHSAISIPRSNPSVPSPPCTPKAPPSSSAAALAPAPAVGRSKNVT